MSRKMKKRFGLTIFSRGRLHVIAMTLAAATLSSCTNVSSLNSVSGRGVTLLSLETERNGQSGSSELRPLQERTISRPKPLVFSSIINALTDLGFRVTAADLNTGFLTAVGGGQERISIGLGGLSRDSDMPVVSAFVEERSQGVSVVRVVFAKSDLSSSARGQSGERLAYEASTYDEFFSRLDSEIQSRSIADPSTKLTEAGDGPQRSDAFRLRSEIE